MKKIRFITAALMLMLLILSSFVGDDTPEKNSLGKFFSVKGITIFYMAEPIHEYEILGTIKGVEATHFGPQAALSTAIEKFQKKGIEADALLLKTEDMDVGTIIKFSDPELSDDEKNIGKTSLVNNTYMFFKSNPIQEYEVICEIKIGHPGNIGPGAMMHELWMKMNRKCPEGEALILSTNLLRAEVVKFK
ncbi:MAG: hypothetical protein WD077_00860 [Bacteroidia bacterium]